MNPSERIELEHRLTSLETSVERLRVASEAQQDTQTKLVEFMGKYEARWGFLFMIGAALWAVFSLFKDDLLKLVKAH